ncbi:MAG: hypothetical protein A2Z21_09390 [Candidatus Fraserbacteria bacterium RBG_16_55_9]|uniref:Uncharacterized protein n=1 Tax=Fraserbacteria sp. (strain RBG_16_55_9) TaxID=1817864 RepID=A0A1F5USP7_FRAXR|nr:MAG: hypothetical protein A2Z21_09390 [Candidatus Fraserbacteria bacterium RBG_16_55_9]
MNEWMIRWAFSAPFVTVGTQLCAWITLLALISYGIAFLNVNVRGPWGWGVAISAGVLTVLAAFSAQSIASGPLTPDHLPQAMKYSAMGVLLITVFAVLELFFRKRPYSLEPWSMLIWDFSLGVAYSLGFLSCGPYFATLSASASVGGWQGTSQLLAYAMGLLILTGILMLLIALLHRYILMRVLSEGALYRVRLFSLLGLFFAGILGLWA